MEKEEKPLDILLRIIGDKKRYIEYLQVKSGVQHEMILLSMKFFSSISEKSDLSKDDAEIKDKFHKKLKELLQSSYEEEDVT